MPQKSYGFAIGNLRARENALMNKSDMAQLAALKSTDSLAIALRDRGFGDRLGNHDVPQLLQTESRQLWQYLNEISPDDNVFKPFLLENDFHNLKAILKSLIRNIDCTDYLLTPSVYDTDLLQNAIKGKRFDILPDVLRNGAERAYQIITSGGDSQLCDAVIDACCMKAQLQLIENKDYKCPLAGEIIKETVFLNTVKAALRCAKAHKDGAFLDETLVETGIVSKDALKSAALSGIDKVLDLLRRCGRASVADAFEKSSGEFEKYCDNAITAVARKAKLVTLGFEPVIGYYMARRIQEKNVRIIYSAIKTGQSEETIMGRLRELYG